MANTNCNSCEELRQDAPSLIVNGFDETMEASLMNNTGLNPSSGNDDCTDLNNMNDCLVGNMEEEVDLYEVCDWKPFMKNFIPNVWTTLKGIISAICGLWTNVTRLVCRVNLLMNGASFKIGETASDGSYVVAGKGVSFYEAEAQDRVDDVSVEYIAGGLLRITGSCIFHDSNFTDAEACPNLDTDVERTTTSRLGNTVWSSSNHPGTPVGTGGELVYEVRIKKSQYPQLGRVFSGFGLEGQGGSFHAHAIVFDGDSIPSGGTARYAYGQHGSCVASTGDPVASGYSRGHIVPNGWLYIQVRLVWIDQLYPYVANSRNGQYTPVLFAGVRMNTEDIC